jgi:hypothetical protein
MNFLSAPKAVLNEVEQRSDCVQAQTHLLSEFGGGVLTAYPESNHTPIRTSKRPYFLLAFGNLKYGALFGCSRYKFIERKVLGVMAIYLY